MSNKQKPKNGKETIINTFLSLYGTENFEDITVSLICKKAKVERSTFYYHFNKVRDILDEIENQFLESYKQNAYLSWKTYVDQNKKTSFIGKTSVDFIYENKDLLTLLIHDNCDYSFVHKWRSAIKAQLKRIFKGEDVTMYILASSIIAFYKYCINNNIDKEFVNIHAVMDLIDFTVNNDLKFLVDGFTPVKPIKINN